MKLIVNSFWELRITYIKSLNLTNYLLHIYSILYSTSISISTICYISISVQGQILPIYPSLLFSLLLAILWLPATSRSRYVVDSSHSRYINSHTKHFLDPFNLVHNFIFIFNTTFFQPIFMHQPIHRSLETLQNVKYQGKPVKLCQS